MEPANLLKSKATIYIAPVGETVPDETSVAAGASWGGNWDNMGFTNAPLAFQYQPTYYDMVVEQYAGVVKRVKTAETLVMETTLAEITAANIAYACGRDGSADVTTTAAGASQKGYEELGVGGGFLIDEFAVGFEGERQLADGSTQPIRVFIPKCNIRLNGNIEFSARSGNPSGVPIQIMALADEDNGGRLFTWQRVTAAATS